MRRGIKGVWDDKVKREEKEEEERGRNEREMEEAGERKKRGEMDGK